MKDVPWHPDEHLMPMITWIRGGGVRFTIHLDGIKKDVDRDA